MYIPKYKKRQILIGSIIVVFIIGAIILANSIFYRYRYNNNSVERMDKMEKYFAAEAPLIMINTKDHIIGYYMGDTPILHYAYDQEINDGLYSVRYEDSTDYFEIRRGNGFVVGFIEVNGNIELQRNFDGANTLVYSKYFY